MSILVRNILSLGLPLPVELLIALVLSCSAFMLLAWIWVFTTLDNHRWDPSQTYNSMNWYRSNIFMPVSTSSIQRGDVIYYRGHIAIALGGGLMIDSWPHQGVGIHPISARGNVIGAARPFI